MSAIPNRALRCPPEPEQVMVPEPSDMILMGECPRCRHAVAVIVIPEAHHKHHDPERHLLAAHYGPKTEAA